MTKKRFIDMVRNYAREARRTRRSYTALVNELYALYSRELHLTVTDADELEQALEAARTTLNYEYAPYDAAFELVEGD